VFLEGLVDGTVLNEITYVSSGEIFTVELLCNSKGFLMIHIWVIYFCCGMFTDIPLPPHVGRLVSTASE